MRSPFHTAGRWLFRAPWQACAVAFALVATAHGQAPPPGGEPERTVRLVAFHDDVSAALAAEGAGLISSTYVGMSGLDASQGPAAMPAQPTPAAAFATPVVERTGWEEGSTDCGSCDLEYTRQILPQGLIYRTYLAGQKESRFRSEWNFDDHQGWLWDIALGGRIGLWRYGTSGDARPEGFQIDLEGAGLPRLDIEEGRDVNSVDFRAGVAATLGNQVIQTRAGYYHLSSHLGDEFLLKHPGYPRLNYSKDVLIWGLSYYFTDEVRVYGEAGFSFYSDISEAWEFQFGLDYSPAQATGRQGAPFVALNGHLREEINFGGNFVCQAGWAWRRSPSSGLFRMGFEYFNGHSDQFSFYEVFEQKVGMGMWYDY